MESLSAMLGFNKNFSFWGRVRLLIRIPDSYRKREPLEDVSQSGNSNIVECLRAVITCSRSEEMCG
jgi:hypothetical protein